jgi:hypothetical protein
MSCAKPRNGAATPTTTDNPQTTSKTIANTPSLCLYRNESFGSAR